MKSFFHYKNYKFLRYYPINYNNLFIINNILYINFLYIIYNKIEMYFYFIIN